jgi:hypothetical protein
MSEDTKNTKLIVQDNSAIAYLMDTGRFEHCYRIARLMASASLIPDHLRIDSKTKQALPADVVAANCFMVVNQAFRWEFDPFGVAPETYVIGGKLAFQGKLVAAAINARAGLEERLSYEFEGKPGTDDFAVIVSGRLKGEAKPRTVRVSVGQAKTQNDMWRKDPEQKLIYTGAIKWARRHTPEIILGVLIEDEVEEREMRNVTPAAATQGNPYADAPPAVEANSAPAKKPAKKAAKEDAPPAEEKPAEEAPVAEAEVIPSRNDMYQALKEACRDAEVSPATAEAKFRKAGLIPEGKRLAECSDEQLHAIHKARLEVLPSKFQPAQEGDQ